MGTQGPALPASSHRHSVLLPQVFLQAVLFQQHDNIRHTPVEGCCTVAGDNHLHSAPSLAPSPGVSYGISCIKPPKSEISKGKSICPSSCSRPYSYNANSKSDICVAHLCPCTPRHDVGVFGLIYQMEDIHLQTQPWP